MQFEPKEKEYNQYVETITPVSNSARNCLWAFLIGGLIMIPQNLVMAEMATAYPEDGVI